MRDRGAQNQIHKKAKNTARVIASMKCHKFTYHTKAEARTEAARHEKLIAEAGREPVTLDVYRCSKCRYYHHTSRRSMAMDGVLDSLLNG